MVTPVAFRATDFDSTTTELTANAIGDNSMTVRTTNSVRFIRNILLEGE